MNKNKTYKTLAFLIAAVWFVSGLFCKILNLVPRHQQIVSRILDNEHARLLTVIIGVGEIAMAIWILSGIRPRLNAVIQILAVAAMNVLEFILVPDLLLWGKLNSVFAFIFIVMIYCHEFILNKESIPVR